MFQNKIIFPACLGILLITFIFGENVFAQVPAPAPNNDDKVKVKQRFGGLPAEWEGIWKGVTVNVLADGRREEIPMELHINAITGSANKTWKILYGKNAEQTVRPYEIIPVEGEPHKFVVDEKNGLFIDNQLLGKVLYSQFMVTTNLVTTRFEIKGDELNVEMMMFDLRSPRQSKLTGGNIEVASYKFRSTQFGVLKRDKKSRS